MTHVYVARGENRGEPESYTLGAYITEAEAKARIKTMKSDDEGFDFMWVDKLELGKAALVSNR